VREQECRRAVERVLEDRSQGVTEARVGDELGVAEERNPRPEEVEAGEWLVRSSVFAGEPGGWSG